MYGKVMIMIVCSKGALFVRAKKQTNKQTNKNIFVKERYLSLFCCCYYCYCWWWWL